MVQPHSGYRSYLVRVWSPEGHAARSWRILVECIPSGKRKGFTDWESALAFLQAESSESNSLPVPNTETQK